MQVRGWSRWKDAEVTDPRIAADAVRHADAGLPEASRRLRLLADPTRLRLLVAIHAAPDSTVGELAEAAGISANTASQALARLLEEEVVSRRRQGRFIRWSLTDDAAHDLLHTLGAPHSELHPPH